MLSTTYIVDVYYEEEGKENVKKSIFVKVPLMGDASKDFKQVRNNFAFTFGYFFLYLKVNVREHEMYTNVLPLLQQCLDDNCSGGTKYFYQYQTLSLDKSIFPPK